MVPPIFAAAGAATSHPRDVRHTAPLLTAGTRAPAPFGLLLRSVIPPTRTARLSPARALLEPIFEVLLSLMAFICPHCSRISPACQEFTPRAPSHAESARKFDKTALPAHDRLPDFPSARRSRPAVHSVPRRPTDRNRRPSEWLRRFHPERQNTRRFRAGCRWFCFCRDYFLTSPKRTAVTAPLPSAITTLMVCWPAPMLVLSSTVTQLELKPLSPLLLSYVRDFTSTSST